MITNFEKYNESVRDLMTPRPMDDIMKNLHEFFNDAKVNKENIIQAFDKMKFFDLDNLYVVFDYENYYDNIDDWFFLIGNEETYEVSDGSGGEFICYPNTKIAKYYDGDTDSWYFDGSHIEKLIEHIVENNLSE